MNAEILVVETRRLLNLSSTDNVYRGREPLSRVLPSTLASVITAAVQKAPVGLERHHPLVLLLRCL